MKYSWVLGGIILLALTSPGSAYPLYGSEAAGIGRVEHARLAHEGLVEGRRKVKGELLALEQVDLRLENRSGLDLPATDPALARQITDLLGTVLPMIEPLAPSITCAVTAWAIRSPGLTARPAASQSQVSAPPGLNVTDSPAETLRHSTRRASRPPTEPPTDAAPNSTEPLSQAPGSRSKPRWPRRVWALALCCSPRTSRPSVR